MPESLYAVFGCPVRSDDVTSGTAITRQVETVDNDQVALDILAVVDDSHTASPGTTLTFTVETLDNDEIAPLALLGTVDGLPDTGTVRTSSVETLDEDDLAELQILT